MFSGVILVSFISTLTINCTLWRFWSVSGSRSWSEVTRKPVIRLSSSKRQITPLGSPFCSTPLTSLSSAGILRESNRTFIRLSRSPSEEMRRPGIPRRRNKISRSQTICFALRIIGQNDITPRRYPSNSLVSVLNACLSNSSRWNKFHNCCAKASRILCFSILLVLL